MSGVTELCLCRLGAEDDALERLLAGSGCEVHCFDPSIRRAHLQDHNMWIHRLSVDWRDPNPAVPIQRLHSGSKKLAVILSHFGHRQVRGRNTRASSSFFLCFFICFPIKCQNYSTKFNPYQVVFILIFYITYLMQYIIYIYSITIYVYLYLYSVS